jgi:hypothetical protein
MIVLLFNVALFVDDTPIPLPEVKASILTPVSFYFICFADKSILF